VTLFPMSEIALPEPVPPCRRCGAPATEACQYCRRCAAMERELAQSLAQAGVGSEDRRPETALPSFKTDPGGPTVPAAPASAKPEVSDE
jgi:hypothetical protein